ncbi:hypothetical protein [Agrobacterium tumefaciens]|jgi:hypothetical protein|uniref:hypothetical protein n=1 Tax=Agrobacterium tumefaciens TaxID=358 RepID=UPI001CBDD04E|nr:hypothetical protein [Agrobacterium tumefaciens]
MLLLRILTLPIAMFVFAALYTMAIKAPHAVETGSLLLWSILLLLIVAKFIISILRTAIAN